jgi:hypothetical protein
VDNARALGWSLQAIAEVLRVTRQSVHKKHRGVGVGAGVTGGVRLM